MESSQKFLRFALATSLLLGSLSLFVYSLKSNPAHAQAGGATQTGYVPVGIIEHELQREGTPGYLVHIIGYSANPVDDNKIRVLAKEWVRR